jgi:EPS-associated MarR family transcriptional regulator
MLTDDARYRILKTLESHPDISQRQLAEELNVSLGKINFCIKALIEKGMIKARNFSQSNNKKRYLYVLTPAGIESKAALTKRFLSRKISEYDALKIEIEELQRKASLNTQSEQVEP